MNVAIEKQNRRINEDPGNPGPVGIRSYGFESYGPESLRSAPSGLGNPVYPHTQGGARSPRRPRSALGCNMPPRWGKVSRGQRRGAVLVIVLVVVVVLALAAYTFSTLMIQQFGASKASGRQIQARAVAESGVEAVRMFVAQDEETRTQLGGVYDNPEMFQGVLVSEDTDPRYFGRYTVIAPALDDEGNLEGIRYGLEDESARLNLNSLLTADQYAENGGREVLMSLPAMTEEVADAILDWIDEDDEPREYGVEADYYTGLQPGYLPKNGPLETVEELLLIRGVTPQMVFGLDMNRNGVVDPFEADGSSSDSTSDSADGSMDRGWSAYLTLHSKEKNFTPDGQQRIFINASDLEQLQTDLRSVLDDEWVNFILAYRLYGPSASDDDADGAAASGIQLDLSQEPQAQFTQVLDLVDAVVSVPPEGDDEPIVLRSPVRLDNLGVTIPVLADNLTTNSNPTIPGRLNINQAPRMLLAGVPGIEEDIVEEIISRRETVPDPENPIRKHETWLLLEGVVDLEEMRLLSPFINIGGDVFRAQVIGYYQVDGIQSRNEVILDSTLPLPRILFWRDLSHLPQGYPVEVLGVDATGVR